MANPNVVTARRTETQAADTLRFVMRYPRSIWHYGLLLGLVALFLILGTDFLAELGTGAGEATRQQSPLVTGLTLTLLSVVVLVALVEFLWLTAGQEVVEISREQVIIRHSIFGFGPRRAFRGDEITAIFLSRYAGGTVKRWLAFTDSGLFDFKRGKIGISLKPGGDGAVRTFRFGGGLPQRDTERVLNSILAKFPQYAPRVGSAKSSR